MVLLSITLYTCKSHSLTCCIRNCSIKNKRMTFRLNFFMIFRIFNLKLQIVLKKSSKWKNHLRILIYTLQFSCNLLVRNSSNNLSNKADKFSSHRTISTNTVNSTQIISSIKTSTNSSQPLKRVSIKLFQEK